MKKCTSELILCLYLSTVLVTCEVNFLENCNVEIEAKLIEHLKRIGPSKVITSLTSNVTRKRCNGGWPHFENSQFSVAFPINRLQVGYNDTKWKVVKLEGFVTRHNCAQYAQILLIDVSTLNLILNKDHLKIQLFNSVAILIQYTRSLKSSIQYLAGNHWPELTFLLNRTNSFKLCHFCQKSTHLHVWENFIESKTSPPYNKFRNDFHLAPMFVRNAIVGTNKITDEDYLDLSSKYRRELKFHAFLSTQIQSSLNTSVHFLREGPHFDHFTIQFFIVVDHEFDSLHLQIQSFGERTEVKFLTRRKLQDFDWNWVQGPYDVEVWICFCVTFLMAMVVINLILKFEPSRHNIMDTFLLMLRIVYEQHLERLPSRRTFFRVAFSSWLIFCLIITQAS